MMHWLDEAKRVARDMTDVNAWQSLDIDYEYPRVERLWMQWADTMRIYLHVIHATHVHPMYHPHPWSSVVEILAGRYKMALGHGAGTEAPPYTATLELGPGSRYAMNHPDGWHSVRPLTPTVLSIMVTGSRWQRTMPGYAVPKYKLQPLTVQRAAEIIDLFQEHL